MLNASKRLLAMEDSLPTLLKSQHEEVLIRLDTLISRVGHLLDSRGDELPTAYFNTLDVSIGIEQQNSASSVPSGHSPALLAPEAPASADYTPIATPAGSGQVTPKRRRAFHEYEYQEAKEQGQRVESIKRQSADAAQKLESGSTTQICSLVRFKLIPPYRFSGCAHAARTFLQPLRSALGSHRLLIHIVQCSSCRSDPFQFNFSWCAASSQRLRIRRRYRKRLPVWSLLLCPLIHNGNDRPPRGCGNSWFSMRP